MASGYNADKVQEAAALLGLPADWLSNAIAFELRKDIEQHDDQQDNISMQPAISSNEAGPSCTSANFHDSDVTQGLYQAFSFDDRLLDDFSQFNPGAVPVLSLIHI